MGLLLVGGTVKRDVFVDAFPLIAEGRHLPLLNPVASSTAVARTGRLPSASPLRPAWSAAASPARRSITGRGERADQVRSQRAGSRGTRRSGWSTSPDPPGARRHFDEVGPPARSWSGSATAPTRSSAAPRSARCSRSTAPPSSRTLVEGGHTAKSTGPETTAVAKPGYAVGAIKTRTGLSLDGFVLIFMKIKGDRLDPSDSYESPVLGDSQGGSPASRLGGRQPVVGVQGRAAKNVNALGLILVK